MEFICDNSVETSDPHIQVAIDQAKFKYFGASKDSTKKSQSKGNRENSTQAKTVAVTEKTPTAEPVKSFITPKFMRAKTLHIFLYYLVYKHKGKISGSSEQSIYHEDMNWKIHTSFAQSTPSTIAGQRGFGKLLEDEEKAHLPIQCLTRRLRSVLLRDRKYLFSTYEVIENLCRMGLISMGPQYGKKKDNILLYVHKHACIKDTTTAPSAYMYVKADRDYERKLYTFETEDDVHMYWLDLQHIAFNTPLGAGGFDSILFVHLKRNWQSAVSIKPFNASQKINAAPKIQKLLENSEGGAPDRRVRLKRLKHNSLLKQKENKIDTCNTKKENSKQGELEKDTRIRERTYMRTLQKRPARKRAPFMTRKTKQP
ncbi:general transcription factor 3C polypeptide 1 [Caerostris extrusa]|uniref:General transcription factor 3C polypeptide 1 n=1 Tax=Caerostris extrusa TaxID=172846 RepID=A0AAV4PUE3_CAEEX|nr:general transcription factor 3C polypeptide 1 [Caerostris extrusa]